MKTLVVSFGVCVVVVVMLFNRGAKRHRSKHRENISLQRSYQEFQSRNEQCQNDGSRRDPNRLKDEDQRYQREHQDVARGNVGKKTDHQRERLGKNADQLN